VEKPASGRNLTGVGDGEIVVVYRAVIVGIGVLVGLSIGVVDGTLLGVVVAGIGEIFLFGVIVGIFDMTAVIEICGVGD
jgi:hypothetical protein